MKEQDKDRPVSSGLEEIFGSAPVQSDEASECKTAPSRSSESPREARDGGRRNRPAANSSVPQSATKRRRKQQPSKRSR